VIWCIANCCNLYSNHFSCRIVIFRQEKLNACQIRMTMASVFFFSWHLWYQSVHPVAGLPTSDQIYTNLLISSDKICQFEQTQQISKKCSFGGLPRPGFKTTCSSHFSVEMFTSLLAVIIYNQVAGLSFFINMKNIGTPHKLNSNRLILVLELI